MTRRFVKLATVAALFVTLPSQTASVSLQSGQTIARAVLPDVVEAHHAKLQLRAGVGPQVQEVVNKNAADRSMRCPSVDQMGCAWIPLPSRRKAVGDPASEARVDGENPRSQ